MSLKGRVQANHIPLNKYELTVIGLITQVTVISISGMETEVTSVDLPDFTKATGGQVGTSEVTIQVPSHHNEEIAAMEAWFREGQDPVSPTYKKSAILTQTNGPGDVQKIWQFNGTWASKRKLPDMAFENDGEMSSYEYTLMVDEISNIS